MPHEILIPDDTRTRLTEYLMSLKADRALAGKRLRDKLAGIDLLAISKTDFLNALINTKVPQIFAESAVAGNFHSGSSSPSLSSNMVSN